MALSLIQTLIKPSNFKIYDEQYGLLVWSDIKVQKVSLTCESQTSNNPLSNEYIANSTQTKEQLSEDLLSTKVLQPVSMTIDAFVESISTSLAIAYAFQVPQKTFKLVSKGITAQGMSLTQVAIDQSPEMLSAIKLSLTFEQAEKTSTTGFNPQSSSNDSTYGITVQPSTSVADTVQSVYNKASSLWS